MMKLRGTAAATALVVAVQSGNAMAGVGYPLPPSCGSITLEQTPWEGNYVELGIGCFQGPQGNSSSGAYGIARAFNSGADGLLITCVHVPVYNNTATWPVSARIWSGHPLDPVETHQLLAALTLEAPAVDPFEGWFTLTYHFDELGGVAISADAAFFVEIAVDSRLGQDGGDGGSIALGMHLAPQSAPTFGRTVTCGQPDFINLGPSYRVLIRVDGEKHPTVCSGDFDLDGQVGSADLATLLGAWGTSGAEDLTGDGVVDAADLAELLGAWGPCP